MLRRFIEWLLVRLHLRKLKETEPPIEILLALVPYVLCAGVLLGAMRFLGLTFKTPWYRKLLYRLTRKIQRLRLVVVGW